MTLRLFAIGIDDVRDIFGAAPAYATHLWELASPLFAAPTRKNWFTRPPMPDPHAPQPADAQAMITGGFIPPDRQVASWQLLTHWLSLLSWSTHTIAATGADIAGVDFDLARAGVAADFHIDRLFKNDLALPLRVVPGLRAGYCRHDHALGINHSLLTAIDDLPDGVRQVAVDVDGWLAQLPLWRQQADVQGRSVPDVVALVDETVLTVQHPATLLTEQ